MALDFTESNGGAIKSNIEYQKLTNGDNVFRMVGGILPRYNYWVKTRDGKDVSIECLGFNRDTEKFDNIKTDWVRKYFPDLKCSWSYCIQVIDPSDPTKIKVMALKKKMLEQIKEAAKTLGNPTDLDKGYDIHVKRAKTGPLPYNVEYTVQQLKLKPAPVSDEVKALIAEAPSIDEQFPVPTPEQQLQFLKDRILAEEGNTEDEMGEFDDNKDETKDFDDDIPF